MSPAPRLGDLPAATEMADHEEVRTPLTALVSAIALLRARLAEHEDEDVHRVLGVCTESAARLRDMLIDEERGEIDTPVGRVVDVREVVRDGVLGASELARDVDGHIDLDVGSRAEWVRVNARTTALAVENILTRLLSTGAHHIRVRIRPAGRFVRIAVESRRRAIRCDLCPDRAFRDEGTRAVERLIEAYGGLLARGVGDPLTFHARMWLPTYRRPRARSSSERGGRKDSP